MQTIAKTKPPLQGEDFLEKILSFFGIKPVVRPSQTGVRPPAPKTAVPPASANPSNNPIGTTIVQNPNGIYNINVTLPPPPVPPSPPQAKPPPPSTDTTLAGGATIAGNLVGGQLGIPGAGQFAGDAASNPAIAVTNLAGIGLIQVGQVAGQIPIVGGPISSVISGAGQSTEAVLEGAVSAIGNALPTGNAADSLSPAQKALNQSIAKAEQEVVNKIPDPTFMQKQSAYNPHPVTLGLPRDVEP